jgi:hypothetical protein
MVPNLVFYFLLQELGQLQCENVPLEGHLD